MTWDDATAALRQQHGWDQATAEAAVNFYFESSGDGASPELLVEAFQQQAWLDAFAAAPRPIVLQPGGNPMADTIETRVAALEQRDADITKALNLILKGQYIGADGAAGQVVALQGGTDDLTGHVKAPLYPR